MKDVLVILGASAILSLCGGLFAAAVRDFKDRRAICSRVRERGAKRSVIHDLGEMSDACILSAMRDLYLGRRVTLVSLDMRGDWLYAVLCFDSRDGKLNSPSVDVVIGRVGTGEKEDAK